MGKDKDEAIARLVEAARAFECALSDCGQAGMLLSVRIDTIDTATLDGGPSWIYTVAVKETQTRQLV